MFVQERLKVISRYLQDVDTLAYQFFPLSDCLQPCPLVFQPSVRNSTKLSRVHCILALEHRKAYARRQGKGFWDVLGEVFLMGAEMSRQRIHVFLFASGQGRWEGGRYVFDDRVRQRNMLYWRWRVNENDALNFVTGI